MFYGVCHTQVPSVHRQVQTDTRWGVGASWIFWRSIIKLSAASHKRGTRFYIQ